MKFYVISDNTDTKTGLRLSGIEGQLVENGEQLHSVLDKLLINKDIGIILITQKVVDFDREYVFNIKLNTPLPLIVEIPDRHGGSSTKNAISSYISEAIGVKL